MKKIKKFNLSKNTALNYNGFMSKKVSLYVVAKKEMLLLFLFMFLVAATSFIFGIKVGKEHAYRESGIIREDRKKVQMIPSEDSVLPEENAKEEMDTLHTRLEEAIKKQMVDMAEEEAIPPLPPGEEEEVQTPPPPTSSGKKYTIQLGSYRSRQDADTFAQGFIVRGYKAIIREVDIPGKGIWYRVSLGIFDTNEEAKKYIKKEESLFQGEDYIIRTLL